jgi:hypothetical protein
MWVAARNEKVFNCGLYGSKRKKKACRIDLYYLSRSSSQKLEQIVLQPHSLCHHLWITMCVINLPKDHVRIKTPHYRVAVCYTPDEITK